MVSPDKLYRVGVYNQRGFCLTMSSPNISVYRFEANRAIFRSTSKAKISNLEERYYTMSPFPQFVSKQGLISTVRVKTGTFQFIDHIWFCNLKLIKLNQWYANCLWEMDQKDLSFYHSTNQVKRTSSAQRYCILWHWVLGHMINVTEITMFKVDMQPYENRTTLFQEKK